MGDHSLVRIVVRSMMTCGLVVMLFSSVNAQYRVSSALFKAGNGSSFGMQRAFADTVSADSVQPVQLTVTGKSTTTAVLLSAILPGAGQVYTGRYWKVPIILGFGGYFAYEVAKLNDKYRSARDAYSASVGKGENSGQGNPQMQYERDFYRDERDRFVFYFLLTYLLNIVDAYVDASLFNFDVGDNLTGGASLKIRVPLY